MKKEYMKPTMRVVELHHKCQILAGSGGLGSVQTTGLDDGDGLDIDDEEVGTGFWGR